MCARGISQRLAAGNLSAALQGWARGEEKHSNMDAALFGARGTTQKTKRAEARAGPSALIGRCSPNGATRATQGDLRAVKLRSREAGGRGGARPGAALAPAATEQGIDWDLGRAPHPGERTPTMQSGGWAAYPDDAVGR